MEMMLDLETLDTKPGGVVLSIGAVIWETFTDTDGNLRWEPVENFMRVLELYQQFNLGMTMSESTLLWWMRQDRTAQQEAFGNDRCIVGRAISDLHHFVEKYADPETGDPGVTRFWASPDSFDFPIWEALADKFSRTVPWSYRQKRDVRTVVDEASYSAKDHKCDLTGVAHTPVFDCLWQIDLLTAARQKLRRRINS